MKRFACDSVVPGCDAVFTGQTDGEVLLKAVDHADEDHGMFELRARMAVEVLDHLEEAA